MLEKNSYPSLPFLRRKPNNFLLYFTDISDNLQQFQIENEHFQIDLLISKSNSMEKCSKSTNEWTFIFVNQRPVNIKLLEKILKRIFNDKALFEFTTKTNNNCMISTGNQLVL